MKKLIRYLPIVLWILSQSSVVEATPAKPASNANIAVSAESTHPLQVGAQVPDVSLINADGISFKLKQLLKNQPTVLIFYRGGWCVYCSRQLGDLKKIEEPLQKLGYQILAVSPDKIEKIRGSLKKYDLSYMLVSDSDAAAIQAFGLAYKVDDATYAKYKKDYGLDLEEHSGQGHHLLPVPAVFVVDQKGKIFFTYANPDYRVRVDPQALLSAATQLAEQKKPAGSK